MATIKNYKYNLSYISMVIGRKEQKGVASFDFMYKWFLSHLLRVNKVMMIKREWEEIVCMWSEVEEQKRITYDVSYWLNNP